MMKKVSYLLFLSLVLSVFGCKQEEENPDPTIEKVTENPNPAENNSDIILENKFGDTSVRNFLINLTKYENDFYYGGVNNSYSDVVGKIDAFGQSEWARRDNFTIRDSRIADFTSETPTAVDGKFIEMVGANLSNEGLGKVAVYDNEGNSRGAFDIEESSYKVTLNRIRAIGNGFFESVFHSVDIVGKVVSDAGVSYPYFLRVTITYPKDGVGMVTFEKTNSRIFTEYPNRDFLDVWHYSTGTGKPRPLIIGNSATGIVVYSFDKDLNLEWTKDIIDSSGLVSGILEQGYESALGTGNNLYVAGATRYEKETPPENGGYWEAGIVAKIDLNSSSGNIGWIKTVNVSDNNDGFIGCFIQDNVLYAYGYHSSVFYNYDDGDEKAFSNGLLTKIDANTGNVISNQTFGDKSVYSRIGSGLWHDNKLYLVGETGYTGGDSGSENWFMVVNP